MPVADDALTPGWRLVHVGFEGDDVSVAGINPWKGENWTSTGRTIIVEHPTYPAQRHAMQVYVLGPEPGGPVFATGEFSNGVWGIYVPRGRPLPASSAVAEDSLQVGPPG